MAVARKALPVVKYLLEREQTGIKEYIQMGKYQIKNGVEFTNSILPILCKTRDLDTLNYIAR